MTKKVAVIMGSDSDYEVMKQAFEVLDVFEVQYIGKIMSAHRTPTAVATFAESALRDGFGVIIAGAGKSAHLAGVLAAGTCVPVIGVPLKSSALEGLDALLSTVQMPKGVPVASVAIDGAANAALLAVQILAIEDQTLTAKLLEYRAKMTELIAERDFMLQNKLKK